MSAQLSRPWPALVVLGVSLLTAPTLAMVASIKRASNQRVHDTNAVVAKWLPWPDLAIASGARHLRFLSLEEPAAAFSDSPAGMDTEAAGGSIAPPRRIWTEQALGR